MAKMKHRKLYPTSKDNATISCPDTCDPTCTYGCDPYADFYPVSPPPPPPPQRTPNLSGKQGLQISPLFIVIGTLLAGCFLLASFYFIVVKRFCGCNRSRPRQRQPEANDEEFLDENRGPAIDHPIWYINTIGLQPSVIDSITIFRYKKDDKLIEGTECAVCLNAFQNDETLRFLPKCSHAFHVPCIDTWLRSHTNCPVCRAGIISMTTPVVSNRLNSNNIALDEDSRIENDEELSRNQLRDDEICENRTDTGEIIEFPQVHDDGQAVDNAKMRTISEREAASWIIDNLNAKITMEGENTGLQSVKRSVSLDSLLAENIRNYVVNSCLAEYEGTSVDQSIQVDHVFEENVGKNSRTLRINDGGSTFAKFLHKRPVRMKRSFSYSERSILSKQFLYPRINSVLPL